MNSTKHTMWFAVPSELLGGYSSADHFEMLYDHFSKCVLFTMQFEHVSRGTKRSPRQNSGTLNVGRLIEWNKPFYEVNNIITHEVTYSITKTEELGGNVESQLESSS